MRELGDRAFYCVVSLWCYTAENCPDGRLNDMDAVDVAEASIWQGDASIWLDYLINNRWLDRTVDGLMVHDWEQMQPWAARDRSKQSEANRANALKRWEKTESDANRNAIAMQSQCDSEMQSQCPHPNPTQPIPNTDQNTPSISPVPGDDAESHPAQIKKKDPALKPEPVQLNRETLTLDNLTAARIETWTRDYPGVDIDEELAGINAWCAKQTAKALKVKRWSQFIDNWMQKALADKAAGKRPATRQTPIEHPHPFFDNKGVEFASAKAMRRIAEEEAAQAEREEANRLAIAEVM